MLMKEFCVSFNSLCFNSKVVNYVLNLLTRWKASGRSKSKSLPDKEDVNTCYLFVCIGPLSFLTYCASFGEKKRETASKM